jgi:amidase
VSDDFARLDATAQAELVRSGEVSAAELVEAAIERCERLNPEINAVIHPLYDEGRAASSNGQGEGPFAGVPFLLKDLGAAYAGQPLHMGMRVLKEAGFQAPVDTFLAERFRAAGLVTIGKTNTPELGILPTTEPDAYGATRNPWDIERTPGGSSGGSAAAVAAGLVPVAHANDGGGSIRIPASCCGLVGLKPTRQRISEGPLTGDNLSGLTAELIVSRSVRDTAAVLDAVHGPAPGDPYVAPPPARAYVDELDANPNGLRIGFTTTPPLEVEVDPACEAAVADAARLLESLGHHVDASAPTDALLGEGAVDVGDTFLTRWAAGQTMILDTIGALLGRPITSDEVEPLTWALAELGRARSAGRYLEDVAVHQTLSRVIAAWYEDGGYDLLLTPTMAERPALLGSWDDGGERPMDAFERSYPAGAFTAIFNLTGQPAISLPLYWSDDGLPVGVQLVAPFGREDLLIAIAAQLERARPWAERTPPVFAGL